jgi:hypothetical protein
MYVWTTELPYNLMHAISLVLFMPSWNVHCTDDYTQIKCSICVGYGTRHNGSGREELYEGIWKTPSGPGR